MILATIFSGNTLIYIAWLYRWYHSSHRVIVEVVWVADCLSVFVLYCVDIIGLLSQCRSHVARKLPAWVARILLIHTWNQWSTSIHNCATNGHSLHGYSQVVQELQCFQWAILQPTGELVQLWGLAFPTTYITVVQPVGYVRCNGP